MSESPTIDRSAAKPKDRAPARGSFEINANPKVKPPYKREQVVLERAADGFAYEPLAERYGAKEAQRKIGELVQATIEGTSSTVLLWQDGPQGLSLVHVWFGPNFSLFRHSHPRYGNCLYYVLAGEIRMGKRLLGRGSTFFVPDGQPYKYTAGPAGVELLEFRCGAGEGSGPGIEFAENSFEAIQRIIDVANANESLWEAPERMGDTVLREEGANGGHEAPEP